MKHLLFSLLCLAFLLGSTRAHAQNPYKEFGIEIEPLTLSKGTYNEFFTNDSLVRIGSVILDTRNNRIARFVVVDTAYSEATLEPELTVRFLQPDPYAAYYPDLSPYSYAANNPLFYTDPTGKYIVIHYYDDDNGDQTFIFDGTNGSEAPDNAFVQAFMAAYNYATSNGEGTALLEAATNSDLSINLGAAVGDSYAKGDWVFWNPTQGITDGGNAPVISPAIMLEHEMDHSVDRMLNPDSHAQNQADKSSMPHARNMEEQRVMEGTEQRTARSVGEIGAGQRTRANYFSAHPVMTTGSTSTIIDRRASYMYWKNRYNQRKRQGLSTAWEEANMKRYKN